MKEEIPHSSHQQKRGEINLLSILLFLCMIIASDAVSKIETSDYPGSTSQFDDENLIWMPDFSLNPDLHVLAFKRTYKYKGSGDAFHCLLWTKDSNKPTDRLVPELDQSAKSKSNQSTAWGRFVSDFEWLPLLFPKEEWNLKYFRFFYSMGDDIFLGMLTLANGSFDNESTKVKADKKFVSGREGAFGNRCPTYADILLFSIGLEHTKVLNNVENKKIPPELLRLLNQLLEPFNQHALLFSAESRFSSDLDQGNFPKGLRQAFDNKGISLSDDVTVEVEDKNFQWVITDEKDSRKKKKYTIIQRKGQLNIYQHGVILTANATRKQIITKDSHWLITDKSNRIYRIRKAKDRLDVYKEGYLAYCSGAEGELNLYVKKLPDIDYYTFESATIDPEDLGIRITTNPLLDFAPQWSPDGRSLVYEAAERREGGGENTEIFIRKLITDTGEIDPKYTNVDAKESPPPIPLTTSTRPNTLPTFAPDGSLIAFYRTSESDNQIFDLYVVALEPQPSEPILLVKNVNRSIFGHGPVWLPLMEGLEWRRYITYIQNYEAIYVIDVDAVMNKEKECAPKKVEGLKVYESNPHIEDLTVIQRDDTLWLTYTGTFEGGQKRIAIEPIDSKSWRVKTKEK